MPNIKIELDYIIIMNDTMQVQVIDIDGIFDATVEYRGSGENYLVYPHSDTATGSKDFEIKMVKRLCNGEIIISAEQDGDRYTFLIREAC